MKGAGPPAFTKCCIYVTIMVVLVHRRLRTPVGMLLLGLVLGVIVPGALAQDSVDDLRSQRENIRREAADAAAQLNALSAEDLELVEALEALDAHIALQETKIAAAAQSIEMAEAEAAQAQTEADILAGEIEAIRDRLRRRAIDAYVAPASDALDQLNSDDLIGSALRREYLDDIVGDEYEIVDQLRGAIAEQEAANRAAQALLAEAQAERAELDLRRAELDVARTEAEQLRVEVQERIAEWQTRSDEFAEADRLIGEEIRRLEEEARIAAEAEAQRLAEEEARRLAEEEAQRLAEEEAADDVEGVVVAAFGCGEHEPGQEHGDGHAAALDEEERPPAGCFDQRSSHCHTNGRGGCEYGAPGAGHSGAPILGEHRHHDGECGWSG